MRNDEFDDRKSSPLSPLQGSDAGKFAPLRLIVFAFILSFIAFLIWSYIHHPDSYVGGEESSLPRLSAASDAYRVRPDDPGGMEIPNRDSSLFAAMQESGAGDLEGENSDKKPRTSDGGDNELGLSSGRQFSGLEKTLQDKLISDQEGSTDKPSTSSSATADNSDSGAGYGSNYGNALPEPKKMLAPPSNPDLVMESAVIEKAPDKIENLAAPDSQPEKTGQKDSNQDGAKVTAIGRDDDKISGYIDGMKDVASESALKNQTSESGAVQPQSGNRDSIKEDPVAAVEDGDKPGPGGVDDSAASPSPASSAPPVPPLATRSPGKNTNGQADYYVQLGSVGSKDKADKEWQRLQNKYDTLLKKDNYRVQKADLGEKGVFFRLQAGPVTHKQAQDLCDSLKKAGKIGGCLVVAR